MLLSNRIVRAGTPIEAKEFIPAVLEDEDTVRVSEMTLEEASTGDPGAGNPLNPEAEKNSKIANAEASAEKILENARIEAEEIRKEASRKGYEEGYARGREEGEGLLRRQGEQEKEEFQKELCDALENYSRIKKKLLDRYLDELTAFALTVVEKVIHVSLRSSGKVIARMITMEAEKHKKTAFVKIYMDRIDYESTAEVDADLTEELSNLSDNIKFVVLDNEPEGSVIMETPEEIVDLGVATQMRNIRSRLKEVHLESGDDDV